MDTNGDGYIQYKEFIEEAHKVCIMISELYLRQAFDLFDLSDENQGQIPIDLLQSVMCSAISSKKKIEFEQWEEFVETFDENKDMMIDYNEFKNMMMNFHENFVGNQLDDCEIEISSLGTPSPPNSKNSKKLNL